MEDGVRKELYYQLGARRVNTEILFPIAKEQGEMVNVRLRPWKNSNDAGQMILAAAEYVDDALLLALYGLLEGMWIPLNWNQRWNNHGIAKPGAKPEASRGAPIRIEKALEAEFRAIAGTGTRKAAKSDPGASQTNDGHSDMPLRMLRSDD